MALIRLVLALLFTPILLIIVVFGLLSLPPIEGAALRYYGANRDSVSAHYIYNLCHFRLVLACGGPSNYIMCIKPGMLELSRTATGASFEDGVTVKPGRGVSIYDDNVAVFFSHAAYRQHAYDPAARRMKDVFIMSRAADLPEGVLPAGVLPAVINYNTDEPEHKARRDLMAEVFLSLGHRHPSLDAIQVTSAPGENALEGLDLADAARVGRAVVDTLGFNLFRLLYGVELNGAELALLK